MSDKWRCDGYELFGIKELRGVTFCRKDGARRVYELVMRLKLEAEGPRTKKTKTCRNCKRTSPISAGGECSVCGTDDAFPA